MKTKRQKRTRQVPAVGTILTYGPFIALLKEHQGLVASVPNNFANCGITSPVVVVIVRRRIDFSFQLRAAFADYVIALMLAYPRGLHDFADDLPGDVRAFFRSPAARDSRER